METGQSCPAVLGEQYDLELNSRNLMQEDGLFFYPPCKQDQRNRQVDGF